jgi:hypothetical protein
MKILNKYSRRTFMKIKHLFNREHSWLLFILLAAMLLLLTSCPPPPDVKYYQEYGAPSGITNVFNDRNSDGKADKLDTTASYYIGNLKGEFKVAAQKAIQRANAINGVNVNGNGNSDSSFTFTTYKTNDGANAVNTTGRIGNNIRSSKISFNEYNMTYSQAHKNHVAIHEMGHTLGLKDLKDPKSADFQNNSIMYYAHDDDMTAFEDYKEFDKENLKYVYGG